MVDWIRKRGSEEDTGRGGRGGGERRDWKLGVVQAHTILPTKKLDILKALTLVSFFCWAFHHEDVIQASIARV